ncbi:hypothetical protein [Fervidibacter sacchari]
MGQGAWGKGQGTWNRGQGTRKKIGLTCRFAFPNSQIRRQIVRWANRQVGKTAIGEWFFWRAILLRCRNFWSIRSGLEGQDTA